MAIYYVSTTGNNANAGSIGSPWATIVYAMGATSPVTAGDTIYVRSGTYTGYVLVGKSGTNGSPITIETYPADMPSKAHLTTGGSLGSMYFQGNVVNWTIRNLEISDTWGGAGIYWDDGGSASTHSGQTTTIEGCSIHDNNSGDNATGILLQRPFGHFVIQNNVFHDNVLHIGPNGEPVFAQIGNNSTAVLVFGQIVSGVGGTIDIKILHNEIYNEGVGYKVKHPFASDQTITLETAYNYIHNNFGRACIEYSASDANAGSALHNKRIHHNLCINSSAGTGPGIKLSGDFGEWDCEVDHNTCYSTGNGIELHREDPDHKANRNNIHDNIFYPQAISAPPVGAAVFLDTADAPYSIFDYNCYFTNSTTVMNTSGTGFQSFASWRAATNAPDAHSINANPLFVSTSDFHLQAGSPCRNTDSGGHDMGCYELRTEAIGPATGAAALQASVNAASTTNATMASGGAAAMAASVQARATVQSSLFSAVSGISDYVENKIVDHVFRNRAWAVPTAIYIALFTVAPTDAGGGTEVTGGSYARVRVGPSDSSWTSTQNTTTAVPSSGNTGRTTNGGAAAFPIPTANWGLITHFGVYDAALSGNLIGWGPLSQTKTVSLGDPAPSFAAGALTITFA